MAYKNLTVSKEDGIAIITINRPEALNALNRETLKELRELATGLENDDTVKVLIITGAGDKSFVSGADIKDVKDLDALSGVDLVTGGQKTFAMLENLSKPVIAAVNGYCLGGGLELALGCDFIIASEKARFGVPEAKIGVFAGWGGIQRLSKRVGTAWAKMMNMTGNPIDAQTALRINLANQVVPADKLLEETKKIAKNIMGCAPLAVKMIKTLINEGADIPIDKALGLDAKAAGVLFSTQDQKEGMNAFVEKRKPQFKGR
jgi:enoyl-CoA hydratase